MHLCWILAIVMLAIELVTPLTFLAVFERRKSPAEIFARLGRSLPFVTIWTLLAIAAVVLATANGVAECVEVASVALLGFIPVCFWRVYLENYDFVVQFIRENKERMRHLLVVGIGVDESTFETISSAVETALVEFWTKMLTKKWSEFNQEEIGELMFDSGIETAKVIVKLGNDARWTVFAFMRKWRAHVERIRVPLRAKEELEGCSVERQIVNCIAIILANETREVREARARQSGKVNFPYLPTVGLAAQKAVTEGILRWPRGLLGNADVRIASIDFDTANLYLVWEGRRRFRFRDDDIPECVVYTLKEMVEAGFLRLSQNGKTTVSISFRNEEMVVERKDWNHSSFIERAPFRCITSVTKVNGNPAFVIESSEVSSSDILWNGSRVMEGILNITVDVTVREQKETWLHQADIRDDEAGIWGELESFVQPIASCPLSQVALWLIRTCRSVLRTVYQREGFREARMVSPFRRESVALPSID